MFEPQIRSPRADGERKHSSVTNINRRTFRNMTKKERGDREEEGEHACVCVYVVWREGSRNGRRSEIS
eukprot:763560-Hanusia_phi.AAC.5